MSKKARKGFTFKVSEKAPAKTAIKARDGVILAGCTFLEMPIGGFDVRRNRGSNPGGDDAGWC